MKKRRLSWIITLALALIVLTFPADVSAHPGRTDSSGGHTNSSTGEYHYHHGYSEHNHYDMDGDGDIDCPYDFDDQTGASGDGSPNSNANNHSKSNYVAPTTTAASKLPVSNEREEGARTMPIWVYFLLAGQAVLIMCLWLSNTWKKSEIDNLEARIILQEQSHIKEISDRFSAVGELESLHKQIIISKQEQAEIHSLLLKEAKELEETRLMRCRIKGAPMDIVFAKNGLPIYWKPNMHKPYGDYTVYVNRTTGIYHVDRLCSSCRAVEDHIFNVVGHTRPCKKCADGFYSFSSVPDWFAAEKAALETKNSAVPPDDPNIKVNYR